MSATTCPNPTKLRALSLGQLSDEESDALFEHLHSCSECRSEMETVEDGEDSLVASLREPVAGGEYEREPDCRVAVARALGALSGSEDASFSQTALPARVGEYEIIRPLGRGGMGSVHLAKHTKLGREVALKTLASHRLADGRMRERFESEMRAIGRLSHPNIVTAHDAREIDGNAVLITEFIDGLDLGQLSARTGRLRIADACEVIRQIAVALQYTSDQGFVHRDVKPSNIMVSSLGEVKLLDLGLARLSEPEDGQAEFTATGQAMGTADYVAPEQVNDSRSVDVRADIYSLGCTLFKVLTGRTLFAEEEYATVFAKMTAHVSAEPPRLRDFSTEAPSSLCKLLDSMLAKSPAERPQSPIEVAEALQPFCSGSDLPNLVTEALQREQPKEPVSAIPRTKTQASASSSRSLLVAIGLMLCTFFIGFFAGVWVIVTYPDGTIAKMFVPEGGTVSIEPNGQEEREDEPGARLGDAEGSGRSMDSGFPDVDTVVGGEPEALIDDQPGGFSPLFLGVLVEEVADPRQLQRAIDKLSEEGFGRIVSTDIGTWFPVAGEVNAPIISMHGGQKFALVSRNRSGRVTWEELNGHLSATMQSGRNGGRSRIELDFDSSLAGLMQQLSTAHLNRQLAIVFNHRIVTAPYIRSGVIRNAVIEGNFTNAELKFLSQSLNGGLVDLPPENVGRLLESDVWVVESAQDSGKSGDVTRQYMVFNAGQFYLVDDEKVEESGHFEAERVGEHFHITLGRIYGPQTTVTLGIFRFLDDGKLQICFNEAGNQRPGSFVSEADGPNDVLITAVPAGDLSNSSEVRRRAMQAIFGTQPGRRSGQPDSQMESSRSEGGQSRSDAGEREQPGNPQTSAALRERLMTCERQALMLATAFQNFHDAYRMFPASEGTREGSAGSPRGAKIYPFSWRVAILPFIEEAELFQQYRFHEPWDSEHNLQMLDKMPDVFRSPFADQDQPRGETNFIGFAGAETALGKDKGQIGDLSQTIMVMETRCTVEWTNPMDIPGLSTPDTFLDHEPFAVMADGTTRRISRQDLADLSPLITAEAND